MWEKINKNAFHLTQSDLEDMDLFGLSPGWRVNLSALEALIKEGYTLHVEEWGAVKSVQELRAMFSPENIARVRAARKAKKEAERKAAEEAAQREAEKAAREERRWDLWVKKNLAGLVATTVIPLEVFSGVAREAYHFNAKWYSGGVTYRRFTIGNVAGWLEYYGNAAVAYVPPAVADRWYRQRWEANRGPEHALLILNRLLSISAFGDDYAEWVSKNVGKGKLVDIARSGAPIPLELGKVWAYAAASKCYRIPIAVDVYNAKTRQRERWVGYGAPNSSDPIEAWVPLGQENQATWPSPQEIAQLEREHEESKKKRSAAELFWEA